MIGKVFTDQRLRWALVLYVLERLILTGGVDESLKSKFIQKAAPNSPILVALYCLIQRGPTRARDQGGISKSVAPVNIASDCTMKARYRESLCRQYLQRLSPVGSYSASEIYGIYPMGPRN